MTDIWAADHPRYKQLRTLRYGGYDGPLDQDGKPNDPTSPEALAAEDLRRRGAGT